MKKTILIVLLTCVVITTGCVVEDAKKSQETQTTEAAKETKNTVVENTVAETTDQESNEAEQNTISDDDSNDSLADYMASVKEQSDGMKAFLEKDALTQHEMNTKSQELYELWDGALNYLWGELKSSLPEDAFARLLDEQRTWIADKEKAVEEAGKEVEGGSLYPLVVNGAAASITEERVYELYELLK